MELQMLLFATSIASLALVLILTVPVLKQPTKKIYSRIHTRDHDACTEGSAGLYEDEDGVATEESQAEFRQKSLLPKTFALIGALLGLPAASVDAVLITTRFAKASTSILVLTRFWSLVAVWVLILVQATGIFIEHVPVKRFRFALCGIFSASILLSTTVFCGFSTSTLASWTVILQAVASAVVIINLACLPRRPDIFSEEKLVDQYKTVSVIGRISFSWANLLLQIARKRTLELADLPHLPFSRRSQSLAAQIDPKHSKKRLWRLLVGAHAPALIQQWVLTLISSVLTFAPQFFLLRFLQELEKHEVDSAVRPEAWVWVFGLGVSLISRICIDLSQRWLTSSRLDIPVQAQLSSLVFQKVLLRQDSHNAEKVVKEAPVENGKDKNAKAKKPDSNAQNQLRQSVINHMKLDSSRVTMFCTFNSVILSGLLDLILASTFIIALIGWKSLVAGVLASLLVIPVTTQLSKFFGKLQFSLMSYRDRKASILSEALQGIRQIKFSALEQVWEDKIMAIRSQELKQIWKTILAMSAVIIFINLGPLLLTTTALSVFTLQGGVLLPSTAFTCIGLFDNLRTALGFLPLVGTFLVEGWISLNRLEKFFNETEKVPVLTEADSVSFEEATVAWPRDEERDAEREERSILRDINLQFPNGKLSVITGKTGSGKSLLLAAILGEVNLLAGTIKSPTKSANQGHSNLGPNASDWIVPSSVAFVSQSPWIENSTIKENITFGLPFDSSRYQKTISACALEKDLELFADGDMTEVGPKGISLSGGQKWRLAFARALYSRAGVLLLDDILSAVDAHVGKWILDKALTGELAEGRTRILATHHGAACLSKASYLVHLADGTVKSAESVDLAHIEDAKIDLPLEEDVLVEDPADLLDAINAKPSSVPVPNGTKNSSSEKEEKKEVGRVTWKVYKAYFNVSGGWIFWGACLIVAIVSQFFDVGRNWWLKLWTETYENPSAPKLVMQETAYQIYMGHRQKQVTTSSTTSNHSVYYYVAGYAAITLSRCFFDALQILFQYSGSLKASKRLYSRMTHTVLRAPLRWLDTVPSGRILNRFTTDFATLDLRLLREVTTTLSYVINVIIITFTSVVVSPSIIPLALVTLSLFSYIAWQYINGAREIKRVNSITSSPIYDQLGSILEGLSTVRAFGKTKFYTKRMSDLIDDSSKSAWYLSLLYTWMSFRMSILGAIFATIIASAIMVSGIQAALAGFLLTFALQYTGAISGLLQSVTQIELGFNAVERIVEYANLPTESEEGKDVPASWPTEGGIEIEDLVAGYAEDLPPVLKGLTFSINPRERVGVVGRTGAGKSSMANALFRFISAKEGSIRIDNIDISTIKLQDLRSRLAIIPQDPFLFSGTLRSNLDVYEMRSDDELKAVLQHVHLIQAPTDTTSSSPGQPSVFEDLSTPISDGGLNLSQGQRQLVCLARAILTRPKILMLDEATSAVDMGTDAAIQQAIRTEFSNSTLIVIAHRLSTIADFDKVLVLSEGKVAEFGKPADLLKNKGIFWEMVGQSAEKESLETLILGGGN